jgi:hypothetical protein
MYNCPIQKGTIMELKIYDAKGAQHTLEMNENAMRDMRAEDGLNAVPLDKFFENQIVKATGDITAVPDGKGHPTVLNQIAAQMGVSPRSTLKEVMNGGVHAATTGGDASITGRLLVSAMLLPVIENQMREDRSGYASMLRQHAALNINLPGTRWDRPILDFKRPENSRPQPVAELAEPVRMLTIKSSQKSSALLGEAIGIEFSDQALQNATIDFISLSMRRQAEESANEVAMAHILSLLNGDADVGMAALASVVRGGAAVASTLDSAAGSGKLTQTAWVKWLWRNNLRRTITTVVTDFDGALAIENRLGRPTVQTDDAKSKRIDVLTNVVNPNWPNQVDIIITQDPNWPADTIVGFDKSYGYSYVQSAALNYSAMEALALRRSVRMRFDQASAVDRFMDDAWDILDIS